MSSSVIVQGKRQYRPAVYADINADALGGRGTSTGNVAIVGEFPSLKAATPYAFSSVQQVQDWHNSPNLMNPAKLAFQPSLERGVGGADVLFLVNVAPNTAAAWTFNDTDGDPALTLTSRLYGTEGNKTIINRAPNAVDSTLVDWTIQRNGETQTFEGTGSGVVAQLWYSGAELATNTLTVGPDAWLWAWTYANTFAAAGGIQSTTYTPTELEADNAPCGVAVSAAPTGNDLTVTFEGVDHEGADASEVLTCAAGGTVFDSSTTDTKWSRIDQIIFATDDDAYTGTVTVSGVAFAIDATQYENVGEIVTLVNASSGKGFNAQAVAPSISTIPASPDEDSSTGAGGVDTLDGVNVQGSGNKADVRADLWAIATELDTSRFVSASRAANAHKAPLAGTSEQTKLIGGSVSAVSGTDWDAAFRSILTSNVQIVVPLTTSVTNHAKGIQHCKDAAIVGRERNVWFGAAKNTSLADLFDNYTKILNSEYGALCFQEIRISDARGRSRWFGPEYQAIQCAAIQAGTAVAEPLTRKRPYVLDVRAAFDATLLANDLIPKGLVAYTEDDIGWRIERSVTTYVTDDNPIYSEVSSWESVQASVRTLRSTLDTRIGNPTRIGSAKRLKAVVEDLLGDQVTDGIIKAWQNVVVTDLGDTFQIAYEVAPVEPINFIVLKVNVIRIAG